MRSAFNSCVYQTVRHFSLLVIASSMLLGPVFATASFAARETARTALSPDQRAIQVLSRLTFGARPSDLERIKKIGANAFIEQQLDPDNIDDSPLFKRLAKLPTLSLPTPTLTAQYNPPKPTPTPVPTAKALAADTAIVEKMDPPVAPIVAASPTPTPKPAPAPKNPQMIVTELQRAKLLRAVYSNRQLYEVMADFWENHFSIYANKDADRWLLTSFDRDSVRPFALGRFRDLLGATAHSPAMLFYLDNWQSSVVREYPATKERPARKSGGINENYARELMELHTLGVDGGYSQKDVQEVARCFTGWSIRKPNEEGTFYFNPSIHDNGEKTVLGVKIAAGGGIADGERVLDILAKSPSTARYIATKMARKFLGDDPSPAVVSKAAKVFLATDGSIRETLRSIITSPVFFTTASYKTKVKSPFEFVASALRVTNAETDANRPVLDWISKMGQPIYGRVTPDGYPDRSSEWLSNNDLLARFNFASALAMDTIKGTTIDPVSILGKADNAAQMPLRVARLTLMGRASDQTVKALVTLAGEVPDTSDKPNRPLPVAAASWAPATKPVDPQKALESQLIALALGTPEFQRK